MGIGLAAHECWMDADGRTAGPARATGPSAGRCTMPSVPPLPDLILYARPGCHLCEEASEAIRLVVADRHARGLPTPTVIERNIEDDPELHRRFLERIPVVEIGDRRVELIVTVGKVRRLLHEAFGDAAALPDPAATPDPVADQAG